MLKGKYIQIVESLSLGLNNRLHLIKIDDEFFLISATNKKIEFLTKVNLNEYKQEDIKNPISEIIDFKTILKKYVPNLNFANQTKKATEPESVDMLKRKTQNSDEIKNNDMIFKGNLEKLRNITNTINGQRSENEQKKVY
jgi:flagellar protein FliO/FliZ